MLRKNLSTEDTEGTDHLEFLVASLEILEEIFFKNGRGPEIIMDRILDARNLKENL